MKKVVNTISYYSAEKIISILAITISIISTAIFFRMHVILAYGDAESHINIAKRVVNSLTPGLAQLGGIWLPLPHVLMLPFVSIQFLWHSGLAGSIVGGAAYVIASLYIYKITYIVLNNRGSAFLAFLVFALNPNILYLQSTPMSELPLIAFFCLSIYYFLKHILNTKDLFALILAALFGFCSSLSRYDGWFLVLFESLALLIFYWKDKALRTALEGKFVLFATLSYFGIILWFLWDFLILGDPFYFSNSPFSAKSQQQNWLAHGELITYKNIFLSIQYYFVTALRNSGLILFFIGLLGFFLFFLYKRSSIKFIVTLLLGVPFIFYVVSLYSGQAVIFIPDLTPKTFEWRLFNVRYGVMMIPFVAFFIGYMLDRVPRFGKAAIISLCLLQLIFFSLGIERNYALDDGVKGLSAAKNVDASSWLQKHYDSGLVLLDDYARTLSIIKSNLPIDKVIYVGNKPYWDESLKQPEKYATWVVLQKGDAVWNSLYENPNQRGELFKYFVKVYTSPEILIFKRNPSVVFTYANAKK